ncbi:hypothetical protein CDL15_Pgr022154 [Punica granatum]|uniref:Uncharacterized protein n=1 Tax=Punica granatum TaxID=22663 RepID=A0A218VSZ4_PUNGR|nr:hypothetical protein CDL15_Pgr022154 [Punica granatum]
MKKEVEETPLSEVHSPSVPNLEEKETKEAFMVPSKENALSFFLKKSYQADQMIVSSEQEDQQSSFDSAKEEEEAQMSEALSWEIDDTEDSFSPLRMMGRRTGADQEDVQFEDSNYQQAAAAQ